MKKSHATGFEEMKKSHAALSVDLSNLKVDRVVLSIAKPQGKREKEQLLKSGIVLDPKQTQKLNAEEGIDEISEWFEDETPDLQDTKGIGSSSYYSKCKWLFIKELKRYKLENACAQDIKVPLMFRQRGHRIIYTTYDEALLK